MPTNDPAGSTLGMSGTSSFEDLRAESKGPVVAVLTLQCHPEPQRLGQRALLGALSAGRETRLSRLEPELFGPEEVAGRPLADPYLSRRPLRLEGSRDGSLVLHPSRGRMRVRVRGEVLEAPRRCSPEELAEGVVIELAGRVTLLLHAQVEDREQDSRRFGLIGENAAMRHLREEIRRLADLTTPVLIRGATGTGKELVARALHDAGPRSRGPFVAVNLAALPPALAVAELFGAVRGAFTGATRDQPGFFRTAQGGTLFLDEIGEAPPEVQVMLLRVLETGTVQPLGLQTPERVDVRILAATDADLEGEAEAGAFREPLIHRLSGYVLWLPPLKERRDDLGRLMLHFLRGELEEVGEVWRLGPPEDPARPWLPVDLVGRLLDYDWPGNVRQLRNVVRQLVIGSRGSARLRLVPAVEKLLARASGAQAPDPTRAGGRDRSARKPAEIGPEELENALRIHGWELAAAARELGISRPSMYNLIEAHPTLRTAGELSAAEIRRSYRATRGDLDAMGEALRVSRSALRRRIRELDLDGSGIGP